MVYDHIGDVAGKKKGMKGLTVLHFSVDTFSPDRLALEILRSWLGIRDLFLMERCFFGQTVVKSVRCSCGALMVEIP